MLGALPLALSYLHREQEKGGGLSPFPPDVERELYNNFSYLKAKNCLDQAKSIKLELFYSQLPIELWRIE